MYVDQPGRKHPFLRRTLLSLLGVLVAFAVICCFFGQPKDHTDSRTRRSGVSTILLCGTDEEGYRTDTMILMTLDSREHTVSLLSLPRDTYTSGYSVPKLNSACGAAGGGEAGMENLMNEVTVLLGFRPDRYAMVNFDVVEKIVDLFGGVTFNVPMTWITRTPIRICTSISRPENKSWTGKNPCSCSDSAPAMPWPIWNG